MFLFPYRCYILNVANIIAKFGQDWLRNFRERFQKFTNDGL